MNIYDKTHELARGLKESQEYNEYKKLRKELYSNEETKKLIKEFEQKQQEVQLVTVQGKMPEDEKIKKLQELYAILLQNPKVKQYFDVQIRFNVLLADINKIIAESVKDAFEEM
jgi:Uncharacterized conserved protein